jgi:hypothetical protein
LFGRAHAPGTGSIDRHREKFRPSDADYSSVFESDVPVVVQHARQDNRHAEVSLVSTIAHGDA